MTVDKIIDDKTLVDVEKVFFSWGLLPICILDSSMEKHMFWHIAADYGTYMFIN